MLPFCVAMPPLRHAVHAFLLSLLLAGHIFAQGASASITGTLKDSSGAVVPNSSVVANSVESGRQYPTQTNAAGIYTLAAIPPGHYTLTVEMAGFKRLVTGPVELEVNQIARIDLTLELGATAETIEVQALATVLQTET